MQALDVVHNASERFIPWYDLTHSIIKGMKGLLTYEINIQEGLGWRNLGASIKLDAQVLTS